MAATSVQPTSSDVYYQAKYWNHYKLPLDYISQDFTGDPKKRWWMHFKEQYAEKPFKHALILNCGDGRHERKLYDLGVFTKATAFDISKELLEVCEAKKDQRKITYIQADANKITFKENTFDLVVNVASLHHIQYLNRMMRVLAKALKPNGLIVNFDYIGPHRNQYPLQQWALINYFNQQLPSHLRNTKLFYPHVPTMIAEDPSEAIHPELVIGTMKRYFTMVEQNDTAGGIAYMIITHNDAMRQADEDKIAKHLKQVLSWDREYFNKGWTPPMFSFFIAQPKKEVLANKRQLKLWQDEENEREAWSESHLGTYYWINYLEMLMNKTRWGRYVYKLGWWGLYSLARLLVVAKIKAVSAPSR